MKKACDGAKKACSVQNESVKERREAEFTKMKDRRSE